ncbi:MAG: CotH kinase family protein [Candidatus Faecivivens sp.]|nr:CotH kinase family protein [Candidatus Faecivivens sp.]
MIKNKRIDAVCCIVLALTLLLTVLFMNGKSLGLSASETTLGYENRLFDTSTVHTIDIAMNEDDWEDFLENCTDEEYVSANLVIDGKAVKNVGLRAKGNTSLTSVAQYGNNRYSFKIEFDHYEDGKSYYRLDKLCLNNLIQDNTCMKDYLAYTLMADMGVPSPLCSFVYITVNGEDWGLYLAVEGIEDSFLARNYGSDSGDLYKPDSVSVGGNFDGGDFDGGDFDAGDDQKDFSDFAGDLPDFSKFPDFSGSDSDEQNMPPSLPDNTDTDSRIDNEFSGGKMGLGGFGGGLGGSGMGSSDTKLQYIDDDPESYSNIFSSAKTDVTEADEKRLIASLKTLTEYVDGEADESELESVVDVEKVIRYFVVHDFLCNGDSYTGSMIHNHYLYEKDGVMEMIPWDYNLAFGGFGGVEATSEVNSPIDSPVDGDMTDRPMVAWIFANEEYTALYHQLYQEFIDKWFGDGELEQLISDTVSLISPYVEKDLTSFVSHEDFLTGTETLKSFCNLRAESVSGQLDGTIPSTSEGQNTDSSSLVDASSINLSDMGSQNTGDGQDFGILPDRTGTSSDSGFSFSPPRKPDGESDSAQAETQDSTQSGTQDNTQNAPPEKPDDTDTAADSSSENTQDESSDSRPERPGGQNNAPSDQPASPSENTSSLSDWLILAACGGVLLIGLLIAGLYKKR